MALYFLNLLDFVSRVTVMVRASGRRLSFSEFSGQLPLHHPQVIFFFFSFFFFFFKCSDFYDFYSFFVNLGPYRNKSFKTLLVQISIDLSQTLWYIR